MSWTVPIARDLLVSVYRDWATDRHLEVSWICHPTNEEQPAIMAISGHYASGYLMLESGIHRVREGDITAVATVRVGPWLDNRADPQFTKQRALKTTGVYGNRVRSRLECDNGLVLQNERTLAENRDFAAELTPSWQTLAKEEEDIVRRYDLSPFKVRDVLTGETSGRRDVLGPKGFHRLLCARIDLET